MTAVEVCPICDIAGCRHIRERKAKMIHPTDKELGNRNRKASAFMRGMHKTACYEQGDHPDECDSYFSLAADALDANITLRTQLADVQADLTFMTENRNKWQDSANQRWFRIEEAEARADRAEAALATQPSPDVAELVALLAKARTYLASYVDADWPKNQRSFFPVVQEKWERDMELCWQIDAAIARVKGGAA